MCKTQNDKIVIDMNNFIEYEIAKRVKEKGGRTFYVGGCVRDQLLGIDNKDIDIEIHGVDPETVYNLLKEIGEPLSYGKNFGIYSLKGTNIDIALPRIEKNTGRGHRDFEVYVDPYLGVTKAIQRRDFTINGIYKDILSGEIIDPFNGVKDINNKTIRHINDNSFIEDPLRVLRAAQFASRFEFNIANETKELCKTINITTLSKERVEQETIKALTKGIKPSIFFETLKELNQLDYFYYELKQLINLKQNPIYHPEGDVWNHIMCCLDEATKYRNMTSDSYKFMLLVLFHDLGKIVSTTIDDKQIHSYNHETKGEPIIRHALHRFTDNKDVISYVINMSLLHMKPNVIYYDNSSIKTSNKMFYEASEAKDLIYFALVDDFKKDVEEREKFLFDRYKKYQEMIIKPYVTGDDLINAGFKPSENFYDALEYATKLRLAGIEKEEALKCTISYLNKNMNNKT